MGESGALGNTQFYSTHSENLPTNQILDRSHAATDKTSGLPLLDQLNRFG